MLDKIILGILSLKNEQTVYDLKKAMDKSINHFYTTSYGSIHPALIKMEKKGLVSVREEMTNGRTRKIYSIEEEGKDVFSQWMESEIDSIRIRESSLLRIFFFGMLSGKSRERIISDYLLDIEVMMKTLNDMKKEFLKKDYPEEVREILSYQMETLNFGIDHSAFMKEWFNRFLEREKEI